MKSARTFLRKGGFFVLTDEFLKSVECKVRLGGGKWKFSYEIQSEA